MNEQSFVAIVLRVLLVLMSSSGGRTRIVLSSILDQMSVSFVLQLMEVSLSLEPTLLSLVDE